MFYGHSLWMFRYGYLQFSNAKRNNYKQFVLTLNDKFWSLKHAKQNDLFKGYRPCRRPLSLRGKWWNFKLLINAGIVDLMFPATGMIQNQPRLAGHVVMHDNWWIARPCSRSKLEKMTKNMFTKWSSDPQFLDHRWIFACQMPVALADLLLALNCVVIEKGGQWSQVT